MSYGIIIVAALIIIVIVGAKRKDPEHTYNAKWGEVYDNLSSFNGGISIGGVATSIEQASLNTYLSGPSGSGKSSIVTLNSAFSLSRSGSSIFFNDVSEEAYNRISGYLGRKRKYKIIRVDFSDSSKSFSFNPLSQCKTVSDIQKIALLLYRNTAGETKGEIFWESSAISLLVLILRYLIFYADPKYATFQNALRILDKLASDSEQAIDKLFLKTGDEELINSYKATIAMGDRTLQSVIASTRVMLNLWYDKEICKTTATNTIDFEMLRQEPCAIFLCNPLNQLYYLKGISSLFIQSLFNFMLSRIPTKENRHMFFILDEFGVYKFPSFSVTISNIRKYKGGIVCIIQDDNMLISNYGAAEANQIRTNCATRIYLKNQPYHSCVEISKSLGKRTIVTEAGKEVIREMMTVDEVRMSKEAIIFINGDAPIKFQPTPIDKNIWRKRLSHLPPYQITTSNLTDPPLIPFE